MPHAPLMPSHRSVLPAGVRLLRLADAQPVPWKNGGGLTREIATFPEGADLGSFHWRISAASVSQPGPFSVFEGVDRIIVLTQGEVMDLHDDARGTTQRLLPCEPYRFEGETPISATLPAGDTQDFNLMWRRSACRARMQVLGGAQASSLQISEDEQAILHCASAGFDLLAPGWGAACSLATGDTLVITLQGAGSLTIMLAPHDEKATLLDARLSPLYPPAPNTFTRRALP